MNLIKTYFQAAIDQGASDLHLVGEEKPMLRIKGTIAPMEEKVLSNEALEKEIFTLLNETQKKKFTKTLELDFGFAMGDYRFRVNLHRQEGKIGMAARLIPNKIPTPADIKLEQPIMDLTKLIDGLVLIVGPAGCGKSTTIASMIEEINKTRKAHIITIEDPIEFVFKDKECLVEQREIGADTKSFAAALKHVLRQDPDIIMVGEMRDPETIATVLTAAETGHMVFSTLHTSSAAETVERIVDVFEGEKQKQILVQLSSVLRGIVSQQLLPDTKGNIVAAREILLNTPAVGNLIRQNKINQIYTVMETSQKVGMITMDKKLQNMVADKIIDKETAEKRSGKYKSV